jgi:hypothetical protein
LHYCGQHKCLQNGTETIHLTHPYCLSHSLSQQMSCASEIQLPAVTSAPEDSPHINGVARLASESMFYPLPCSAAVSLILTCYLACGFAISLSCLVLGAQIRQ